MSTNLNRKETELELGRVFQQLSLSDCNVITKCLQSIAYERNEALGRVAELESMIAGNATYKSAWGELKAGYLRIIGKAS